MQATSNKVVHGKAQMEAGKCKKPSKKVPDLWLVVVPKITHFQIITKPDFCFAFFSQSEHFLS
jgi:hypothetical protein